ncbi:hypothetical protein [Albimonas donghaensis]|uniref:hypothetical protein n=1 Tax=Albimonas donghaensis TaxID=356660 RepID=UPI00115FC00F|nr:hypothetical protein [Albimonas donghaensis]
MQFSFRRDRLEFPGFEADETPGPLTAGNTVAEFFRDQSRGTEFCQLAKEMVLGSLTWHHVTIISSTAELIEKPFGRCECSDRPDLQSFLGVQPRFHRIEVRPDHFQLDVGHQRM